MGICKADWPVTVECDSKCDCKYTCHYISEVLKWSACSPNHVQVAEEVKWSTVPGKDCENIPITRPCNDPPTIKVEVTPNPAYPDQDLTCRVTETIDLQGDTITYTYRWNKDGVEQGDLGIAGVIDISYTIPHTLTSADEVWECVVTPHDGIEAGLPASDETEIIYRAGCNGVWEGNNEPSWVQCDGTEQQANYKCGPDMVCGPPDSSKQCKCYTPDPIECSEGSLIWGQTDWVAGPGQDSWADERKYLSDNGFVDVSQVGEVARIEKPTGGPVFGYDSRWIDAGTNMASNQPPGGEGYCEYTDFTCDCCTGAGSYPDWGWDIVPGSCSPYYSEGQYRFECRSGAGYSNPELQKYNVWHEFNLVRYGGETSGFGKYHMVPAAGEYYVSIDGDYSGDNQPNEVMVVTINGESQRSYDPEYLGETGKIWWSCYFPESFSFIEGRNEIYFSGPGSGSDTESVHFDAYRITKNIPPGIPPCYASKPPDNEEPVGDKGILVSSIFDRRVGAAEWGDIEWEGRSSGSEIIEVYFRAGESLSLSGVAWQGPFSSGEPIPARGRYGQYTLILKGESDRGPTVEEIRFCSQAETFCGDGSVQRPNDVGTGGLLNNGVEDCDTGDLSYCPENDPTKYICDMSADDGDPICTCDTAPPTFCGDGSVQRPNDAGTGGLLNDGNEDCDMEDLAYCNSGQVCDMSTEDGDPVCVCDTAPPTFCGDGSVQRPNDAGTGGPSNNGVEDCDTNDLAYCNPGQVCDMSIDDGDQACKCTSPTPTRCGDGSVQRPNSVGTGGLNDDGNEDCDTDDLSYCPENDPTKYACDMLTKADGNEDDKTCVCEYIPPECEHDGRFFGRWWYLASSYTFDIDFMDRSKVECLFPVSWDFTVDSYDTEDCMEPVMSPSDPITTLFGCCGVRKIVGGLAMALKLTSDGCKAIVKAATPDGTERFREYWLIQRGSIHDLCPTCDAVDIPLLLRGVYRVSEEDGVARDRIAKTQARIDKLSGFCTGNICTEESIAGGSLEIAKLYQQAATSFCKPEPTASCRDPVNAQKYTQEAEVWANDGLRAFCLQAGGDFDGCYD
jgi:hypothetical protein